MSKIIEKPMVDLNLPIVTRVKKDIFNLLQGVEELRDAAEPFTFGDIVTETSGTEPLMDRLRKAIKAIDSLM